MRFDNRITLIVLGLLSILLLIHTSKDGREEAVLLGQTSLLSSQFGPKYIHVGTCRGKQHKTFRAIQAQSLGDEIIIDQLNLHYGGGQWERVNIKEELPRGKTTTWLEIRDPKCIEDIEVVARTREGSYSLAKVWAQPR